MNSTLIYIDYKSFFDYRKPNGLCDSSGATGVSPTYPRISEKSWLNWKAWIWLMKRIMIINLNGRISVSEWISGIKELIKTYHILPATKSAKQALFIAIVLVAMNQFCGIFAMVSYSNSIFEEAGSNLSPNTSSIIIGVIQTFAAYLSTVLVDRAGRKVFMSGTFPNEP